MLRQLLSRAILPNFEADLSRTLAKDVQEMSGAVGCMLAPQVYSFQQSSTVASGGAFTPSVKVQQRVQPKGMFHE